MGTDDRSAPTRKQHHTEGSDIVNVKDNAKFQRHNQQHTHNTIREETTNRRYNDARGSGFGLLNVLDFHNDRSQGRAHGQFTNSTTQKKRKKATPPTTKNEEARNTSPKEEEAPQHGRKERGGQTTLPPKRDERTTWNYSNIQMFGASLGAADAHNKKKHDKKR